MWRVAPPSFGTLDPQLGGYTDRNRACQAQGLLVPKLPGDSRSVSAVRFGGMNEGTRLTRFLDWLRDLPMLVGLWFLDRAAAPYPETEADRIRERLKARLRHRASVGLMLADEHASAGMTLGQEAAAASLGEVSIWPHGTRLMTASSPYGLRRAF
jgi:hypothetical protein